MEISDEARGAPRTDKQAAILRGSARGLEIVVDAPSGLDAIIGSIRARLAEAPDFFKGSDVRIRVEDGPLPAGSLGPLEDLVLGYSLRLVEIGASKPERRPKATEDAIPPVALAIGSAGTFDDAPTAEGGAYRSTSNEFEDIPTQMLPAPPNAVVMATAMVLAPGFGTSSFEAALASARTGLSWLPPKGAGSPGGSLASPPAGPPAQPRLPLADLPSPVIETVSTPIARPISTPAPTADQLELALRELEPEIEIEPDTRIVVGPVRSGVILDHRGHLIVFGDVNPGAEVRAAGNIIVLGRLRGLAHAGIGTDGGFIVALHLQPQQLRIGRMVARASDDAAAPNPEIAYVNNGSIVVERYNGRLPNGLAASLS